MEGRRGATVPAPGAASEGPAGTNHVHRRSDDRAVVEAEMERGAWLVMPIGYAPGWRADIDGEALPIRPADGTMSAVRVPAGDHLRYLHVPTRGFRGGAMVSLAALLAALASLVLGRIRHTPVPAGAATHRTRR